MFSRVSPWQVLLVLALAMELRGWNGPETKFDEGGLQPAHSYVAVSFQYEYFSVGITKMFSAIESDRSKTLYIQRRRKTSKSRILW